jgi:hypothetical protein
MKSQYQTIQNLLESEQNNLQIYLIEHLTKLYELVDKNYLKSVRVVPNKHSFIVNIVDYQTEKNIPLFFMDNFKGNNPCLYNLPQTAQDTIIEAMQYFTFINEHFYSQCPKVKNINIYSNSNKSTPFTKNSEEKPDLYPEFYMETIKTIKSPLRIKI